ncbi:MAG: hypothetical protein AAF399_09600, partial [Bacteroidota bacterium]
MCKFSSAVQIFGFSILLGLGSILSAQPIPGGGTSPLQLPNLPQRLQQLQGAGVPTDALPTVPQGVVLPTGQVPAGTVTPTQSSTQGLPGGGPPVTLEGADPVLDEEDAEFEDKPLQLDEFNLDNTDDLVFGHHIFRDSSIKFSQSANLIPPENYVVSAGDIIGIVAYGRSEINESLE